jgi:transposase-like protein
MLESELTDHLGYEKHSPAGKNTGHSRNGKTHKTLKNDNGEITGVTCLLFQIPGRNQDK